MPTEAHSQLRFNLHAKIIWTLDRTYTTANLPEYTLNAVSRSICPFPSKWVVNGGAGIELVASQITENPLNGSH